MVGGGWGWLETYLGMGSYASWDEVQVSFAGWGGIGSAGDTLSSSLVTILDLPSLLSLLVISSLRLPALTSWSGSSRARGR